MEPTNIQPNIPEPISTPPQSSSKKWIIIGVIVILILGAGFYYYQSTKQSTEIMDTQETNLPLENDSNSTNSKQPTEARESASTVNSPTADNTEYVADYSQKAQTSAKGDVTFLLPPGFESFRSIFKSEVSGVSSDAIVINEIRDEGRVSMVINQYIDQDLFNKATSSAKLDQEYKIADSAYKVNNIPAQLYKGIDPNWQDTLIVIPSKLIKILINPYPRQPQVDQLVNSLKF